MDADPSLHPSDQTLRSYGLGKLDDCATEAVNEHLIECGDCRKRVSEVPADSFLERVRAAQKPPEKAQVGPLQARVGGPQSDRVADTLAASCGDSLPPELAAHPDYEIRQELGRGGMGVVYLAHNRLMGRDEVLKIMGPHLMGYPGALQRFKREIQSVARLRHPNIVTAYHATQLGQSLLFAMEYVEGSDLSKLVESKGPMPVAHACFFIYQAALGLQHAHEERLIHRDLKPNNLILCCKGNQGTVKILDFGMAKAAREKDDVEQQSSGQSLTGIGAAMGTPAYMAPEQITDASSVDIRADIYSLGATLYYLLTGRPPFQAKSRHEVYQAHISRFADPLNLVRPDVPTELASLVARMLAKDPAERFQTPGEVAQALKPYCTKAYASASTVKKDASGIGPATVGPSRTRAAEAAIVLETAADQLRKHPAPESQPAETESGWTSIKPWVVDPERPVAPQRRPPWLWPSVAVGVLLLGLFAAWMGGVFKLKSPHGVIVLENVPKDSEILVDGDKFTFSWPGDGKSVEIRAVPGKHTIEVKKDGFSSFVQHATFKPEGAEEVTAHLERLVVDRTLENVVDASRGSTAKVGDDRIPPVGKFQTPFAAPNRIPPAGSARKAHHVVGTCWTTADGQLIIQGPDTGWVDFGDPDWTDYDLTFEMSKISRGGVGAGFRNSFHDDVKIYGMIFGNINNNHILVQWSASGVNKTLLSTPGTIEPGQWHKVKITLRGPHIRVQLDDRVIFDLRDEFSLDGQVNLKCSGSGGRFRNIKVSAPDGTILWEGPPDLPER